MNEENIKITKAIMRVIVFFDLLDYPLTNYEVWKYLNTRCGLFDVIKALNNGFSQGKSIIQEENGFYFLKGRGEIVKIRLRRYNFADKKIKKAVWISKIFKFIPWIKMIAISNIIGARNFKFESDIDLFIITKNNRIWLTRFFCNSLAQLLGLRPKKNDAQDKICLNFFVSEEAMNLSGLMLDNNKMFERGNNGIKALEVFSKNFDIYFIYWLSCLVCIYDKKGVYKKFIQANNWIKEYLPNWESVKINLAESRWTNNKSIEKNFSQTCCKIVGLLIGLLEKFVKKIQLKILPHELKNIMNKDTKVVINDKILKLHINDRREEYKNRFEKQLKTI